MNAITPTQDVDGFDFEFDFDGVRIGGRIFGVDAWLVAGTVAKSLGHRDAADLARTLDDDEKGTHPVRTLGGVQQLLFVSEAGLYKAILQRRGLRKLPGATRQRIERFQRKVFHEVLPTIQRTGSYMATAVEAAPTPVSLLEALKNPETVIALIEHHARETLAERAAHAVTQERLETSTGVIADLHVRIDGDRPKVLAQERIAAATGDLLLSDVAVTIQVDRASIVDWLLSLGLIRRGGDNRLRCTREGRRSGLVRNTIETAEGEPGARSRIRVTANGFVAISEHFSRGATATRQDVIPGV